MSIVLRSLLPFLLLGLTGCLSTAPALTPASESVAALRGGLVGQSTRVSLPEAALRQALEAEYQALQFGRVGVPTFWEAGGYRGEVIPTQLYRIGSQDCRGYTHRISGQSGSTQEVGSACRSGSLWTPV